MRFLREFIQPQEIDNILLEKENGEKDVILRGIFAQAEIKNRNGRCYPLPIMEREAYKLQTKIATTGLTGELGHPEKPDYELANAAIIINSYKQDTSNNNNFIGEAKVLKNTAKGRTAFELAKNGIKMGLSTRALGSLEEKNGVYYVKEDLDMITVDLVADPSAPDAWTQMIQESMEYQVVNGYIKEDKATYYIKKLHNFKKSELTEGVTNLFNEFIKGL